MDRFHHKKELILALSTAICGVLNAIIPYCRSLLPFSALIFMEGWFEIIINIGKALHSHYLTIPGPFLCLGSKMHPVACYGPVVKK